MDNKEINLVEEDDDTNEKLPKNKFCTKSKQLLFVLFCSLIALTIYLIIIISIIRNEKKDSSEKKTEPEPEPPKPKNETIGYINCTYLVHDNEELNLLNENFEIPLNFTIFVDDEKIETPQKYLSLENGKHNITYIFYNDINMDNMFKDVPYILSIDMSSKNNCSILSMKSAFENCSNLNTFKIEGFDTKELKSLKRLFYMTPIETIEFKNFNTENVTDMSYMFYATSIYSIKLSFLNTRSVINMAYMFAYSISLAFLDLPSFDTSNVVNMSHMFCHCEILGFLELQNFNTSKVEDMSYMFSGCYSISGILLSNFDTRQILIQVK